MGNRLSTRTHRKDISNCLRHILHCICPCIFLNTEKEDPQGGVPQGDGVHIPLKSPELKPNIKELIKVEKYSEAYEHLIELESRCYSSDAKEKDEDKLKMQQEVESLYELLDSAITTVLKKSMSISQEKPDLLKMVIQVRNQEEKMDQIYVQKDVGKSGRNPRGWKSKWLEILQESVDERIGEIPNASKASSYLEQLLKQLKEDVDIIMKHVKPCYSKEYNVCKIYADCYQKTISSQFKLIIENRVTENDAYVLLRWIYGHYPGLMSLLTETNDEDQKLWNNDLLPQEKINKLETEYISTVKANCKIYMKKSLQGEEMTCTSKDECLVLNDRYHSDLLIDIIQKINGVADEASKVTHKLGVQVMCTMLDEFICFLESFRVSVKRFEIKYWKKQNLSNNFICTTITIVNSCERFRVYLDKDDKIKSGSVKQNALKILNDIEKKMKMFLSMSLFVKIKEDCKMLVTSQWFKSQSPMKNILKITEEHLKTLQKMEGSHLQDVLEQIHHQLITEYVLRLMKKKLKVKTDEQKELADKMKSDAEQLQKLFMKYGFQAVWLDTALPSIAEIIRLQDVNAIKVEIRVLFNNFPDIKKCHVKDILHIKKLKDKDIKNIWQILHITGNDSKDSSTAKKLFTKSTILKDV
ncbi:tumor necrosis factor alpha-induced protein 2-like isoform X1 [Callorhinchus milii]|uniref:tumor necrosis factor alpha-induced protein 2-like isoform X1 n=1 Tax=Callorhinchus milii TaxID=7868 RepID=UPI001C3F879F|nr:tumor necrosis factor alpha-induced protein 2-like isoform X1 [Callorhinchus milii]XP_007886483.2 tumor necrosis factor alpha-induced protein 2-like isoform X1 [Callorhinchus milii]XP_007886484.2 tumor necrosis factor alpha-induced protein 2-like isoform X1 [Callorhinchus milii]XP_042194102.1 tumor necrosis factor alpha-induced protein 2-like isoform X1 [Callorhinchus milii]